MANDPAFLFYSSDFLSGVTDLTMEERGQYITLLCLQHQKGLLTDKTIRLCVGSVSVDVLSKFKKTESGNFINIRLEEEIQKRLNFVQSRKDNGFKGGRPKKEKPTNNHMVNRSLTYGKAKNNLPENENENENKEVIINKSENGFFKIEECLKIALKDPRWLKANNATEIELLEFNNLLEKRGIYEKVPIEYKSHFANWKLTGKKDINKKQSNGRNTNKQQAASDFLNESKEYFRKVTAGRTENL